VRSLFKPVLVAPEAAERTRPRSAKAAAGSLGSKRRLVIAPAEHEPPDSGDAARTPAAAATAAGAAAATQRAGTQAANADTSADTVSASAHATGRRRSRVRHGPRTRPRLVGVSAPGGRHRLWLTALTVLVVLTAAGTTLALLRARAPQTKPVSPNTQAGLSYAAGVRASTARWVAREITRGAIIACDAVMCGDLYRAGVPSASLSEIKSSAPDPFGTDVIVATPALRSVFGSRLDSEYAPSILATFGHGPSQVQVRVVAADGAAAYLTALSRDLAARKTVGDQLAGNSRIAMPSGARAQLVAGLVDPRLLLMLPALAAQHPIKVVAFFDQAPGAGPYVPLTGVELSGTDRRAGLRARAYSGWLVSFARTQIAQFQASSITTAHNNGRPVVFVRFSRPTPLGLIRGLAD